MSFLPGFECDIFISYSHVDNRSLTEGQKGWIDSFHQALEVRLSQVLGSDPQFFRANGPLPQAAQKFWRSILGLTD